MGAIRLDQFGGMLPAWDDTLLPAGQAASSLNGYMFSGALYGWRQPKLLRQLTNSAAKFAYRIPTLAQSVACAYLVFLDNPMAGDTVKVGEVVYEFVAAPAKKNDVLIGPTALDSANELLGVLTVTGTDLVVNQGGNPSISQTLGDNSVDTGTFPATYPYLKVVAPSYGAAYNATQVAESTNATRLTWLYDFNLTHKTLTFTGGTNSTENVALTGAATWLEFNDPDTSIVRSPVVDDQYNRMYFASPSTPPQYNTYDRVVAGQPPFLLGIPAPACPPGLSVTGGGDAATLGFTTADTSAIILAANRMYCTPIYVPGAMSLLDCQFMPFGTDATVSYFAMCFSDNDGIPGTLLCTSEVLTGVTAGTAAIMSFTNPIGLLGETQYWIALLASEIISIANAVVPAGSAAYEGAMTFTNGPTAVAPTVGSTTDFANFWADLNTSSVQEGRAYVYSWVSAYDEEGPPSPYTLVNGWSNGTWEVGLFQPPDDDQGVQRNIASINIYRTIPSTTGTAVYYFVANVPIGTASYTDILDDSVVALNASMLCTNWFPPPENLQDIQAMPNGMLVGFVGNEIWFCEPYRPHAWPPGYVLTTEFPIVGIGVAGQNCVACTAGYPYVATGVSPSVATLNQIVIPEPCISRGSVLGSASGVFYMSPNGLILVDTSGQASNITETWITRERWNALTPQVNPRAIHLASCYFAFEQGGTDGFNIELASDAASFTIWPQPGGHRVGFNLMGPPNSFNVDNVFTDPWTGIAMLVQNGALYYYDFADPAPAMIPFTWRSKSYQALSKCSYEAFRVFFTVPSNTPALSAKRNEKPTNDASWNTLADDQYLIVRVFADGVLVTVREVRRSGEILRMLSGFKADFWQFEFSGRVNVSCVQCASTVKELAKL